MCTPAEESETEKGKERGSSTLSLVVARTAQQVVAEKGSSCIQIRATQATVTRQSGLYTEKRTHCAANNSGCSKTEGDEQTAKEAQRCETCVSMSAGVNECEYVRQRLCA
eukprot:5943898-Pleurochrysis_carterae.AAC.2